MKTVLIITFDGNRELKAKTDAFVKDVSADCEDVLYATSSVVESLVQKLKDGITD